MDLGVSVSKNCLVTFLWIALALRPFWALILISGSGSPHFTKTCASPHLQYISILYPFLVCGWLVLSCMQGAQSTKYLACILPLFEVTVFFRLLAWKIPVHTPQLEKPQWFRHTEVAQMHGNKKTVMQLRVAISCTSVDATNKTDFLFVHLFYVHVDLKAPCAEFPFAFKRKVMRTCHLSSWKERTKKQSTTE